MSDDLREEIARAVYESGIRGLSNCWAWDSSGLDDEHPGTRARYEKIADAILPIIARVREEAYAKGMEIGGEMAQREADYS